MGNNIESVVFYLGCLFKGTVAILVHENLSEFELSEYIEKFEPEYLFLSTDYKWLERGGGIFNIPDGIREIPEPIRTYGYAKKIIIPASVKKVANIVQYCYVKDPVIVCKGKEPPTLSKEQTNSVVSLRDEVINITVYVPKGCKDAYEKTWQIDRSRVGSERIKFTFVEQ